MNQETAGVERSLGLVGATGVGVGAIVGGGILVLAGIAFRSTGPSALLAFGINGLVAILTALSFAEMSTAFPVSGGSYVFAKKVLSVRAAFAVGWVMWFAYIVAGVLYALGFAEYAVATLVALWPGAAPSWLASRVVVLGLSAMVVATWTASLVRRAAGGGQWVNWGKLLVFAVLIGAGFWTLSRPERGVPWAELEPFLARGTLGLVQAMGFTFIALQGFEVIATVAGEVKRPERVLPRAMLLSLGCALVVYLPLLFIVSTAGVQPGDTIQRMAERNPETLMADAARNYLGAIGFWLVMSAALLSTLSALQANILAASRVAHNMARDRTLPTPLARLHTRHGTPVLALYGSAIAMLAILLMVSNLAAAGAAASLIFLVSFTLGHWTSYLARRRIGAPREGVFRTPLFPLVPLVGGVCCAALAGFQAVAVPAAGGIAALWLGLGALLYVSLFSTRATAVDAYFEATDPDLARLRGHNRVVLVPIANPQNAPPLVSIASALTPHGQGQVLLMNVVNSAADGPHGNPIAAAQQVLGQALRTAIADGHRPHALLTVSDSPWTEIRRITREYGCYGLLLGRAQLDQRGIAELEALLSDVDCHVSLLFAQPNWSLAQSRRILVPVGGRSGHHSLRARLLGSLCRSAKREVTWLRILAPSATDAERRVAKRSLGARASDATPEHAQLLVVRSEDPTATIVEHAAGVDLMILGLHAERGRHVLGQAVPKLVQQAPCATLIIAARPGS